MINMPRIGFYLIEQLDGPDRLTGCEIVHGQVILGFILEIRLAGLITLYQRFEQADRLIVLLLLHMRHRREEIIFLCLGMGGLVSTVYSSPVPTPVCLLQWIGNIGAPGDA